MLSKCANPLCSAPFRTLRKGRLVVLHLREPVLEGIPARDNSTEFEPFWLCEQCCDRFTLLVKPGRDCVCIPKRSITDTAGESSGAPATAAAVTSP